MRLDREGAPRVVVNGPDLLSQGGGVFNICCADLPSSMPRSRPVGFPNLKEENLVGDCSAERPGPIRVQASALIGPMQIAPGSRGTWRIDVAARCLSTSRTITRHIWTRFNS